MSVGMSPIEHVWGELGRTTTSKCGPAVSNAYPGME